MCVGPKAEFTDFKPSSVSFAIRATTPGGAVSFNRVGFHHFAIFLGWARPKGSDSEPVPLLCHLSGDASSHPTSVRLEDFRDIAQKSSIRVYKCHCDAKKRFQVILECLYRVGTIGFNPVTNNCEHFVQEVICGKPVSHQTNLTLSVPFLRVPRLLVGSSMVGAAALSESFGCVGKLADNRPLGILNPGMDLIEIVVTNRGLNLKSIKLNATCTREFEGFRRFSKQTLYHCSSCTLKGVSVCKACQQLCHQDCQVDEGQITEASCCCSHSKRQGSKVIHEGDSTII